MEKKEILVKKMSVETDFENDIVNLHLDDHDFAGLPSKQFLQYIVNLRLLYDSVLNAYAEMFSTGKFETNHIIETFARSSVTDEFGLEFTLHYDIDRRLYFIYDISAASSNSDCSSNYVTHYYFSSDTFSEFLELVESACFQLTIRRPTQL